MACHGGGQKNRVRPGRVKANASGPNWASKAVESSSSRNCHSKLVLAGCSGKTTMGDALRGFQVGHGEPALGTDFTTTACDHENFSMP